MPRTKKTTATLIDITNLKPMSPCQATQQLANLTHLYETTEISSETYDAARLRIFRALELWAKEGEL